MVNLLLVYFDLSAHEPRLLVSVPSARPGVRGDHPRGDSAHSSRVPGLSLVAAAGRGRARAGAAEGRTPLPAHPQGPRGLRGGGSVPRSLPGSQRAAGTPRLPGQAGGKSSPSIT